MGIGVSGWKLARAVSRLGELGVVSGTAIDTVLVRRLQQGDHDGHVRRAMAHFPIAGVSARVLERFFVEGGLPPTQPYKLLPMHRQRMSRERQEITMLANFVEVWLAREGHDGEVGLNLLTKVQLPNLASLYGAMLAGVDYVLMGAGIPREIPGALDTLARHEPTRIRMELEGPAEAEPEYLSLDPSESWSPSEPLKRPRFIPIVSANSLAATLAKKATGRVDGFVVEGPTAGGHNAPPRGELRLTEAGEPIYGERDVVNLAKLRELGLPFWLAGGTGSADALRRARESGAAGIQVGTLFAFCNESGLDDAHRRTVIAAASAGTVRIRTDPRASPTGYPFKVVEVDGIQSQDDARERNCDLGYLRAAYRTPEGRIGYRCAAEPVEAYVAKGGLAADTVGRRCLCNGLTADIGMPQRRTEGDELPLVTSGDDVGSIALLARGRPTYSACEVVELLKGGLRPAGD
ncbi:MAG: putative oxidoreductase [Gemmatimonadetes bacterium]|nr:putative oxidoreductase [Gemmatimonadota bacterium]